MMLKFDYIECPSLPPSLSLSKGQGYDKLKYFIEKTTFWAPASTQSGLYDQLASNKYREIPREEIE